MSLSDFAFRSSQKQHDQKQLGEERVWAGMQGRSLEVEAKATEDHCILAFMACSACFPRQPGPLERTAFSGISPTHPSRKCSEQYNWPGQALRRSVGSSTTGQARMPEGEKCTATQWGVTTVASANSDHHSPSASALPAPGGAIMGALGL